MPTLEVAYSPDLYQFYRNDDAIVVVIDVFRATSAMCTAFECGIKSMIPVEHIEQALDYKKQGFIVAAERKGEVVEGFQLGNSPFHYMNEKLKGETTVITTTNGTRAIEVSKDAHQVIIGSFLNISAICSYLVKENRDVLLLCAGWKGRYNMEDSLFAGAVVNNLLVDKNSFDLSDSATAANLLFESSKGDLNNFLKTSSHRRRLGRLDLEKDIEFCLQRDYTNVIPVLENDRLVRLIQ
ncbi:MAG: 2-phosphosulfolactate phosphatase [Salibacteraceae bacterium]|nr:2-phosphosulfolactate phosphatase [Salibacteraceae bacterium]|tara:strand:- start:35720 stop:36436 length:717 start_codon:yes stop_codon:yes gene_type:complete